MAEISNKTLALLLIAAIVISLGGMLITLNRLSKIFEPGLAITGFVSDTGTVSLEVAEAVAINFSFDTMDWGAGAVDGAKAGCLLQNNYTNGSALTNTGDAVENNCTTDDFYGNTSNFVVENIGNRNITLNLTSLKTARTLFAVSGGNYSFNITNKPGETACMNSSTEVGWYNAGDNLSVDSSNANVLWTTFNGSTEIILCPGTGYGMPFEAGNNEFYMNIRLSVPSMAYGALTDTITLEAISHQK